MASWGRIAGWNRDSPAFPVNEREERYDQVTWKCKGRASIIIGSARRDVIIVTKIVRSSSTRETFWEEIWKRIANT
ncbi:hypothetical protein KPH14_011714 [Odynerus spinipes]|uniref:Uncharacterized protein n=1 Tax=Odynerus spinipes TaxID=1348599 RepID=A0AAD9RWR4_9HYME|nr:hypothetical protein KPH14_011714 [Odynerus spinipes]